jgi:hypothetical protein
MGLALLAEPARAIKLSSTSRPRSASAMYSILYRLHTIWRRIGSTRAVRYVCFESLRDGEFSVQSCDYLGLPLDREALRDHEEQAVKLFNEIDPEERSGSFPSLVEAIEAFELDFGKDRDAGD